MSSIEPILKDSYEVIVIGAGIGGLSTAAVLAGCGLEVLVAEQSHGPGGCCSSSRTGEFTFDTGASVLRGFGEAGFHILRTLFDSLDQQVELIPLDKAYRMYFGDQLLDIYADRQAFTADLGALFPQQAGSILSFMRELDRVYRSMLDTSGPPRPLRDQSMLERWSLMARHPLDVTRLSHYRRMSLEKVLRRHVDNPLALAFFEADLVYSSGYGIQDISVIQAAMSMLDRHVGGTHYAIGSSQQIPDRLERSIVSNGGRLLFRSPVKEVLVEGGRATGVRLAGGRVLKSHAVVSGISVINLFGHLVGFNHLRPDTVRWANALKPASGALSIELGVPQSVIPGDLGPFTVIVDDPERHPGDIVSVEVPSLLDPGLSPEGFHSVSIRSADREIYRFPESTVYATEAQPQPGEDEVDELLSRVERVIPGIREYTIERTVNGSASFERRTGRPGGAVAGPRVNGLPSASGLPGAINDIQGLFLAGDSTYSGRGVALAASSGVNCALATLRYLGVRPPDFQGVGSSTVMETVPLRPQVSGDAVVDTLSAVLESHRCLQCADAPCMQACPAGVDIPGLIRRIGASDFAGAARLVREVNPLGETCGFICPARRLCQAECRRADIDSPVRIAELESLVCGTTPGPRGWPERLEIEGREKIAVIGSGPAGVSCAYFLSLQGYNVELFESGMESGGLPANAVPESRLDRQVLLREIEGALSSGIEFRGNSKFGTDIDLDCLWREGFKAVFLGTGRQAVRLPDIDGINLPGVIDALSFLSSARRRVTRELTPRVAVLGNDDLAVDVGMLALTLGAEQVFLVTDRSEKDIAASPDHVRAAREEGVEFVTGQTVTGIFGEGRVERLEARPTVTGSVQSPADGHPYVLKVKTVLVACGRVVEKSTLDYLAERLDVNADGTVPVDPETLETSMTGVFAGGDVIGGSLVSSAVGDGRRAAISIHRYLENARDLR